MNCLFKPPINEDWNRVIPVSYMERLIGAFYTDQNILPTNGTKKWLESRDGIAIPLPLNKSVMSLNGLLEIEVFKNLFNEACWNIDNEKAERLRIFSLAENISGKWLLISQHAKKISSLQLEENERFPNIIELTWYLLIKKLSCQSCKEKSCEKRFSTNDYLVSSSKINGYPIAVINNSDGLTFTDKAYPNASTLICYE